ncbi:MAG: hypothetical protein HC834_01185 [Rhodospirillales bacterium]|nr:hypothetical protein [Rhodospirillales bacterium]
MSDTRHAFSVVASQPLGLLAGCCREIAAMTEPSTVTGTITYRERIALPPEARLIVRLQDVSRADAKAELIAERVYDPAGQVPISYKLRFDSARIDPRFTYAVSARIEVGGKLWFISDQSYWVLTRDRPATADLILKRVGAPQ